MRCDLLWGQSEVNADEQRGFVRGSGGGGGGGVGLLALEEAKVGETVSEARQRPWIIQERIATSIRSPDRIVSVKTASRLSSLCCYKKTTWTYL